MTTGPGYDAIQVLDAVSAAQMAGMQRGRDVQSVQRGASGVEQDMMIGTCGADDVASAVSEFRPDAVVSIFSPRHKVSPAFDGPRIWLMCHDVERALPWARMPTAPHVGFVTKFVLDQRPERLLLHCQAGVSRSPAFALVAGMAAPGGLTPDTLCQRMAEVAPDVEPNRLVLALADSVLRLDGGLMAARMKWFGAGARAPWGAIGGRRKLTVFDASSYAAAA